MMAGEYRTPADDRFTLEGDHRRPFRSGNKLTTVIESRENIALNPTTSYQRLLVHRCSAYYKLTPESDPASKGIIVISTIESRMYVRHVVKPREPPITLS